MDEPDESIDLLPSHRKFEVDVEEDGFENRWQRSPDGFSLSQAVRRITTVQLFKLLPSPIQSLVSPANKPKHAPRPTAWLDGIRGCAALVVFFEHMSLSVQDSHAMVRAYGSPGATSLWQLPIIRLLYDGGPMVPIFYVTSGCALSLKPLSHLHKEEWQDFGSTISSATFRRAFRLFLPSIAVSFLAMLFTQVGVYNHPYPFLDDNALHINRPQRLPNIAAQYLDWLNWVATQLLYSEDMFHPLSGATASNYGFQLWTISTEFYASMALFITLVGLAHLTVSRRQIMLFGLCAFAFYIDQWDIACFMAGISITELSLLAKTRDNEYREPPSLPVYRHGIFISRCLPTVRKHAFALLFVAALFIASYPSKQASENSIYQPFSALVDSVRFWESIGAVFILASTSKLGFMQKVFTSAIPRYLGRVSYGIYLTHVVFLNVLGWRLVPWIWNITGDEEWWGRQGGFAIGLIVSLMLLVWVADL